MNFTADFTDRASLAGASVPVLSIQLPVQTGGGGVLSTAPAIVSSTGEGSIWGNDAAHNFSNERTDAHRVVLVDINRSGLARLFHFIPSYHGEHHGL